MAREVRMQDHTSVSETHYWSNDELQKRPARDFEGVWDSETQSLTPGKPKRETVKAADPKTEPPRESPR